jgi:glycosyltransferase involved in cell wall biosynthesis
MKIVIMHQTVVSHDAIGNDIEAMFSILSKNHECVVFTEYQLNKRLCYISEAELEPVLSDENCLIIYHHSTNWEIGENILRKAKGKIIIRYHNITPPEFFQPYSSLYYQQCKNGREQTVKFAQEFSKAFWLSDSVFNSKDIPDVEVERIGVCAPFNKIENWAVGAPDESILEKLLFGNDVNLLFVGRVAPNKGHLFLLDVLYKYCLNYDTNITLRIIGKADCSLAEYNKKITDKIKALKLNGYVQFIGEINDATLTSYYLGSDFFLCASEHEGFCVPILEAQYFQLPIIARASSAVPETIGNNQVVLGEDVAEYSAAIRLLNKNEKAKQFLRDNGNENYKSRYTYNKTQAVFKEFLKEKLGVSA